MDRLNNLDDLFTHELKDLYSAEQQILKALPEMVSATRHQELRTAFQEHEQMTRDQVMRLETIALIGAAQRVEHYEIAGYGTARTYARMLGHERAAELLQTTLEEEGNTDHRLTRIAETMVNRDAQRGGMR